MGHGLFWSFVNLGALIAVLAYYLRAPLRAFVEERSKRLGSEISSASSALAVARQELEEYDSKLRAVQAEVDLIKTQAVSDAEATHTRMMADARKLAGEIRKDASGAAGSVVTDLRRELLLVLLDRSLSKAEDLLRVRLGSAEMQNLNKRFSEQVEKVK